jgi:uncharacterized protein (DUF1501 family)
MKKHEPQMPFVVSRRQFLSMVGISGGAVALPSALSLISEDAEAATRKAGKGKPTKGKPAKAAPVVPGRPSAGPRVLVVIELQGGNDGFSMLVPSSDARFRKLRDRAWLPPKELVRYDDRYSLAAGLAPLASQLAFVEGVGVAKPDFSHTSMATRWWQGDPDATNTLRTGFFGRCCDLLMGDAPVVGVSVGGGSAPALISNKAPTVALPGLDSLRELIKDQDERMRPSLFSLTEGGSDASGLDVADGDLMAVARNGLTSGLNLVGQLGAVSGKASGYPENSQLANQLALVRELISINVGIRVIHVPWGAFDTHTGHQYAHPEQMRQLGGALKAFQNDLVRTGLTNRVMVATISEFGRRAEANSGGLDHGSASTAMLLGPVKAGRHGSPVNFEQLDQTGNVAATVNMGDYYATLATWLGLPASELLPSGGTSISTLGIA